jgi:predicted N-acyltransferase
MTDIRFLSSLTEVPASEWEALHDGTNPFVSHAFLHGLEAHGCLREDWGWTPHHATLWEGERLVAAAPGYLKDNSHGEFVFDHAWAHAYAQHGLDYYPKWLGGVPYSPVTGPRLLARDDQARLHLLAAIQDEVRRLDLSSAHINFPTAAEDAGFPASWLPRIDVQYHWRNPGHWQDFEGFLADVERKPRKNIRQERAKVQRAGVTVRTVHGDEASDADLQAMFGFYLQTFHDYGNSPALTLAFLRHLATAMPRKLLMFLADHGGRTIAGALCLRGGDTLYGRYWGALASIPGLHFETCYYQGIDYCLREGLSVFEPGAQGEHKIARGFLPTFVHSRHWIAHPEFSQALARWCGEEAVAVRRYAHTLQAHTPFKLRDGVD